MNDITSDMQSGFESEININMDPDPQNVYWAVNVSAWRENFRYVACNP